MSLTLLNTFYKYQTLNTIKNVKVVHNSQCVHHVKFTVIPLQANTDPNQIKGSKHAPFMHE